MQEVASPSAPAPARRRLPVKASSGRITMQVSSPRAATQPASSPPRAERSDDESMQEAPSSSHYSESPALSRPAPAACAPGPSPSSPVHSAAGTTELQPAEEAARAQQQRPPDTAQSLSCCVEEKQALFLGSTRCSEQPASTPSPSCSSSTSSPPRASTVPRRPVPHSRSKPTPLATGPLNSASTPHVVALPVKRRGSYQSLKRHAAPSGGSEAEEPSMLSLLRKATHWERFGTILVLGCLSTDRAGPVMQTLLAEGYDTSMATSHAEAVESFSKAEVFPDVVLIDCDLPVFSSTLQLISHLQAQNPAATIICLASPGCSLDAVAALQAGAADYMRQPLDLAELVARIERHVQRQHCIKLELETAMEGARNMMSQLRTETALGEGASGSGRDGSASMAGLAGRQHSIANPDRLIAVAETDFEQQIMDLSEENQRLGSKLNELEDRLEKKVFENCQLADRISELQVRVCADNRGIRGQLTVVADQNSTIVSKVDVLEQIMRNGQELARASSEPEECLDG